MRIITVDLGCQGFVSDVHGSIRAVKDVGVPLGKCESCLMEV